MRFKEHDCVVLTADLPATGLKAGDAGTIVHLHRDGTAGEVEFTTLAGKTVAIATVLLSQLRPVGAGDMAHVREIAPSP